MKNDQEVKRSTSVHGHYTSSIKNTISKAIKARKIKSPKQCTISDETPLRNSPVVLILHGKNILNLVAEYRRYLPVAEVIYEHLDLRTVIKLFRTSKLLRCTLDNYKYHHQIRDWDINRRLKIFVQDPVTLRKMLADSKAIMTGHFALSLFDPTWKGLSTLDIIISDPLSLGIQSDKVFNWLRSQEGYEAFRLTRIPIYDEEYTSRRIYLARDLSSSVRVRDEPAIRIYETKGSVMELIIRAASSTHLLNVIGTTTAYCFYPRQTLLHREMHLLNVKQERGFRLFHPMIENTGGNYRSDAFQMSGWQLAIVDRNKSPFEPWVKHGTRSPCDSWTFNVPLQTHGVIDPASPASLVDEEVMASSWSACRVPLDPLFLRYSLDTDEPLSCGKLDTNQFYAYQLKDTITIGLGVWPFYLLDVSKSRYRQSWADFLDMKLEEFSESLPNHYGGDDLPTFSTAGQSSKQAKSRSIARYCDTRIPDWFLEWKKYTRKPHLDFLGEKSRANGLKSWKYLIFFERSKYFGRLGRSSGNYQSYEIL